MNSVIAIYDRQFQSRVSAMSFLVKNGWEITEEHLSEIREINGALSLALIDPQGNVLVSSGESDTDYTRPRFNMLRLDFYESGFSEPFSIDEGDTVARFYGMQL